ncbi:MAG TPA: RDD family protein [Candidatus Nanoarchaeia archaeon]|nr:RDD family protein [Candidatus Nanoarchaeia archaeon]
MIKKKLEVVRFWKRVVAYFIDVSIINLLILFPFNAFFIDKSLDWKKLFEIQSSEELAILSLIMVVISLIYWVIMEYKLQQTIGKMIMKIKVKSVSDKELKFPQIFIRNLLKPFFIAFLIDVTYMFIIKSNQRLMEKFSGTYVGEENNEK